MRMPKKIFFPIFVFLISLPLLIFLFSYTRFFNNELRSVLTSFVDEQTNAKLYLGDIQGSILGSFKIDGAALYYHGSPIATVDTIRISHLPLSLITKTVELMHVELVNPHFYLTRYRNGTFNIDRISKGHSKPGGKFDWTILLKSLKIRGGEFSLYDSTSPSGITAVRAGRDSIPQQVFDAAHFALKDVDLNASAIFSGTSLTANVKHLSLVLERPRFRIDSLKFDFYTSPDGTELSGFRLVSKPASLHADVAVIGQNILDSLDVGHLRHRHFTVSLQANDLPIRKVEDFIELPVAPVSKVDLSLFASGNLDTLNLKQFLLRTDSSYIPIAATFRNVADSSIDMRVNMENSMVNLAEASALLKKIGFPNLSAVKPMRVDAKVRGTPKDLNVNVRLVNKKTSVSAGVRIHSGAYDGRVDFSGLDMAKILGGPELRTQLTGTAAFSVKATPGVLPDGHIALAIDSSSYGHTALKNLSVEAAALRDSLHIKLNLLTSNGNIVGEGNVNFSDGVYAGELAMTEFDAAPFVHIPNLEGNFTGTLKLSGAGFNLDSLRTQISLLTERASLGGFPLDNSAITVELNTLGSRKELQLHSPFLDASATGKFIPHELPGQLSDVFTLLAERFSSKVTGGGDSLHGSFHDIAGFDADLNVKVKDARFLGRLFGNMDLYGDSQAQLKVNSDNGHVSIKGSVAADTVGIAEDALHLNASGVRAQFDLSSDRHLAVWDSGGWSVDASFRNLDVNRTRLNAKILRLRYSHDDSSSQNSLSISALGRVDTSIEFYVEAMAKVRRDSFDVTAGTVLGKLYGVSLNSMAPVHLGYSDETFHFSPSDFSAGLNDDGGTNGANVLVKGSYSLVRGANLHLKFHDVALESLQKLAQVDTNRLSVKGRINGDAEIVDSHPGTVVSIGFQGKNIEYNGAKSKLIDGRVDLEGSYMLLSVQLSKESDSARYALRLHGTLPLTANSKKNLELSLAADSLDVSFLAPFMAGVQDFGATVSGNMSLSGQYSSPDLKGKISISRGRIRLAANEIDYLFDGTVVGRGDKLTLSPLNIRNAKKGIGGTMEANGSLTIGRNTIEKFDIGFRGSLLALNSPIQRSIQGIYGTAVFEAGPEGLKLAGSLSRPLIEGTIIPSGNLTLLPVQRAENVASQGIVYRFPADTSATSSGKGPRAPISAAQPSGPSGSVLDSLKYNIRVETKDNVNLRMIFNEATSEELDAVLGGRLALSNLSGSMELTGDVDIMDNSYYNFYGKQFTASGKLHFTGIPLNPTLDITAQYQGYHYADTSSTKPEVVVVQLKMAGSFNHPTVNISLTVDNNPYQGDPQANAISFILFNEFEDQLTSSQKQSAADNLVTQAGAGLGSSLLSGVLTNFLSRQFSFIRNVGLGYNSSSILSPDLNITTQFGNAVIKVGGQVFSDINNTDVSVDYPLARILGNRLYLQLSRRVSLSNRYYYQRETINMLRLFYQLSF